MAEAAAITHTLAEFVKVSNLTDFNAQLGSLPAPLTPGDLQDRSGYTGTSYPVFHELAMSIISEDSVLKLAHTLVAAFHQVYELEASSKLKTYLNIVTTNEQRSALFFVCQSYRPVSPNSVPTTAVFDAGSRPIPRRCTRSELSACSSRQRPSDNARHTRHRARNRPGSSGEQRQNSLAYSCFGRT